MIKILHRNGQIEAIESAIKQAQKGQTQNLPIYGPAGSGKTFCVKHLLEKHKAKTVYINCFIYSTKPAIACKIVNDLEYPVARRGVPADFIYEKLNKALGSERGLILILDEVDLLQDKNMLADLRFAERFNVSMMLIARNELDLDYLLPIKVEFPAYTKEQLTDILKQEADAPADVLNRIAELSKGDCRIALLYLNRVKQSGDRKNALKILER